MIRLSHTGGNFLMVEKAFNANYIMLTTLPTLYLLRKTRLTFSWVPKRPLCELIFLLATSFQLFYMDYAKDDKSE